MTASDPAPPTPTNPPEALLVGVRDHLWMGAATWEAIAPAVRRLDACAPPIAPSPALIKVQRALLSVSAWDEALNELDLCSTDLQLMEAYASRPPSSGPRLPAPLVAVGRRQPLNDGPPERVISALTRWMTAPAADPDDLEHLAAWIGARTCTDPYAWHEAWQRITPAALVQAGVPFETAHEVLLLPSTAERDAALLRRLPTASGPADRMMRAVLAVLPHRPDAGDHRTASVLQSGLMARIQGARFTVHDSAVTTTASVIALALGDRLTRADEECVRAGLARRTALPGTFAVTHHEAVRAVRDRAHLATSADTQAVGSLPTRRL